MNDAEELREEDDEDEVGTENEQEVDGIDGQGEKSGQSCKHDY